MANRLNTIHGSAHMYSYVKGKGALLCEVVKPRGSTGIVLGHNPRSFGRIDYRKGLVWYLGMKRGHGLCFSGTGGGKNTNLITGALITYNGSALVLDPKGENAWITAERRRQMGQRVVILDPWNQVNETYGALAGVTETISKFNPLSNLNPNSKEYRDDLMLIANGVIVTPDRVETHWTESASDLITGLVSAAVEKAPGVASFRQVRDLLTGDVVALQAAVVNIVRKNPDSYAAKKLARFTQKTNEIASIRSTAETQTAIFDSAYLLDSMETDENAFELADLARRKVTLYLVLPPERLQTHGRWMRLIVQLALRAISSNPQPPDPPVLFLLDELGTINPGAGLPAIEQAFGLLGGVGIRVWGFFQDLSQLQKDYPTSWRSMMGNAEFIQIRKLGNEPETAEYFSNMLGTTTVTEVREFKVVGRHARRVLFARELMELPEDEIIIFRSGTPAFRLRSIPYFKEPLYAGLFRPNPLYAPSSLAPPSAGGFLDSVKLPPLPGFIKTWAKQPISVAAGLGILILAYSIGHARSVEADIAERVASVELDQKLAAIDELRNRNQIAFDANLETSRAATLAYQDKIIAAINPANLIEICGRAYAKQHP